MSDLVKPTNNIIELFASAWESTDDYERKEKIKKIISEINVEPRYFDEIYSIIEKSGRADKKIAEIFKNYGNKSENDILYKVLILDKLYNTNVVDPISIAKGILSIRNFDSRLSRTDKSLVEDIASCGQRREYSFATKYCSCENKNYAIYDSIVSGLLLEYNKHHEFYNGSFSRDFKSKKCSLKRYDDFLDIYHEFIMTYNIDISKIGYKKVDIFLWTYGKFFYKINK